MRFRGHRSRYRRPPSRGPRSSRRRLAFADLVSLILNPSLLTGAFLALVAATDEAPGRRVATAAIAVLFATVIPVAILFALRRMGLLSDVEMRVRHERQAVYGLCIASYVVGGLALLRLGSSWRVWGLFALLATVGVLAAALNMKWKVSIHTMTIASLAAIAIAFFGPAAWPVSLLLPLAAWGRWAVGAHTPFELVVGALLGGVVGPLGIVVLERLASG